MIGAHELPWSYSPQPQNSLLEWSKGVGSSSTSASCLGSNPTPVNFQNILMLNPETFALSIWSRLVVESVCVCVCVCACVCHLPSVSIDDGAATMKKAQQAPLQLQSSRAPQELQRLQSSSEAAELPRSSKAHTSLLCFYKSPELPQAAPSFSEAPGKGEAAASEMVPQEGGVGLFYRR